jgi:hypothetical protein
MRFLSRSGAQSGATTGHAQSKSLVWSCAGNEARAASFGVAYFRDRQRREISGGREQAEILRHMWCESRVDDHVSQQVLLYVRLPEV